MSTQVVERVEDWTDRPFTGGYGELRDLADRAFSGVIRAGGGELFMTKGTIVGIRHGSIEDFRDSDGTLFEAPSDALPLLAIMQERSDEVRAKYYSEETSIAEVDRTLKDGGFTGFIELSENVLSGDYYLVYHQGHSMSVAFVGNSGRLIDDDEAFEQADGEVGIFEVRPVEIDSIEIPDPSGTTAGSTSTETAGVTSGSRDTGENERRETTRTTTDTDPGEWSESPRDTAEKRETTTETGRTEPPTETGQTEPPTETGQTEPPTETGRTETSTETGRAERSTETREGDPRDDRQVADDPETTADRRAGEEFAEGTAETGAESQPAPPERESGEQPTGQAQPTEREPVTDTQTEPDRSPTAGTTETASSTGTTDRQDPASSVESPPDADPTEEEATPDPASGEWVGTEQTDDSAEEGTSLETRAIPSLDPQQTVERNPEPGTTDGTATGSKATTQPGTSPETETTASRSEPAESRSASQPAGGSGQSSQTDGTASREQSSGVEQSGEAQRQSGSAQGQSSGVEQSGGAREQSGSVNEQPGGAGKRDEGGRERTERGAPERLEKLESQLAARDEQIESLERDLERTTEDRDRLEAELETVREERDSLAARVEELESELDGLESQLGTTEADRRMTAGEALAGTDIFVRYHSKGEGTLAKAHGSGIRKSEVGENLRLEKHTQFDASAVSVGGRSYEEFLEATVVYQFVEWVIEDLLFEIRDTGHKDSLSTLYDAIPDIDRAEMAGSVEVTLTEDGQETRSTESFDVVMRDRMGNPLVVADFNDSREAATESMMEDLVTSAERVGHAKEKLAAAFFVTESFFEPGALETASEATRSGLLSRDKRKSFVNLSRKSGYHLCLVEARNENFHLAVPEL